VTTSNTAVLQLHQRDAFERNVTRALAAGAGAGVIAFLTQRLGVPVPLSFLAIAGTALAAVRGDRMDRWILTALSLALPAAPWLFGLSHAWTVALSGAAAGALMVKARQCERGEEGAVGGSRASPVHYGLAATATAGLSVAGFEVARILSSLLQGMQTPALLATVASGTVVALFAGIGGIGAHLFLKGDPVEARCEELIGQLDGDFRKHAERALSLYRACGESLQALPRDPAREELARSLQKMTRDAVELAAEWTGVETALQDEAQRELKKEIVDLEQQAGTARDPVAKRQLQMAAASLKEELDRLAELKLKRERISARLRGQVALLERARVALIGMRSGHAHIKAAEMSALARKFNALAISQSDEAKVAHEVATGSELAIQEAELQAAVKVAEGIAHPSAAAPVQDEPAQAPVGEPTPKVRA
jgi:hypothetical protein